MNDQRFTIRDAIAALIGAAIVYAVMFLWAL